MPSVRLPVISSLRRLAPCLLLVLMPARAFAQAPAMPAPEPPASEGVPVNPGDPAAAQVAATEPAAGPSDVLYGVGLRGRWVSVPSWFLDLFTKENVPLSSVGFGLEFFRRKGDVDIVFGLAYQNMSPPDGNWLGNGKSASIDTDLVQFRSLGLIGVDVAFMWRQAFTEYVGMHYGAGLGLAIVTGKMLRTSNSNTVCNEQNAGDESKCYPVSRGGERLDTEQELAASEGGRDSSMDPSRFKESGVPPALPILNLTVGFDFRIKEVPGLEIRPLEFGFYNAFFLGGGASYLF